MKTVFISISKSDCFTARFERKARRIRRVVCVVPPPPSVRWQKEGEHCH